MQKKEKEIYMGFPHGTVVKNPLANAGDARDVCIHTHTHTHTPTQTTKSLWCPSEITTF